MKILPLDDLILSQTLNFMHSIEFRYAPSSFSTNPTFPKNSEVIDHDYPLRNFNDFCIPRVRNDFLEKFPFFSFTSSWNNLDNRFKTLSSKNEFKLKIKQYLLAKYSGFQCQRLFCYTCSRTNS